MSTPDSETWLSSGQLGKRWKVDPKTVTRYANDEELPFQETPGGHRRFNVAEAEAWYAARADRRRKMRADAGARLTARWAARDGAEELARTSKESL